MKKCALLLTVPLAALGAGACSQKTGKAANSGSTGDLPFTPLGCNYQVSAPDGTDATLGGTQVGSDPTPVHVHVSWAGPTDSTFAVNWKAGIDTTLSDMVYGTDQAKVSAADGAADGVTLQKGYTILYGSDSPLYKDQKTRVHEVHVCGLTAGTTYYYKVGGPGHWSKVYNVATGPTLGSTKPFTFAVTGDSRNEPTVWAQVEEKVQAEAPDFEIFSGDAVNIGANQKEWDALFEASTGSFKVEDFLATCPFMPVNGNHDNLTVNYVAEFALPQVVSPGEIAQGEEWYSFDYGNAHFVMLNDTSASTDTITSESNWMKTDLAKVDRKKTPWIFVVHHKPTYSSGTVHGSDMTLRAQWQPIFDKYKVDIVFNGHDHDYERSKPIRGFQAGGQNGLVASKIGANGAPVAEDGTVYVVAAGAGAPLYSVAGAYFSQTYEQTRNFVIVTIDGRTLHYTAKRLDGSVLDSFDYTK